MLTPKESKAYSKIQSFLVKRHNMPTYRQLAKEMGISAPMAKAYCDQLVKKGYLKKTGTDFSFSFKEVCLVDKKGS